VPGEQPFITGGHQRGNVQEEIGETPFDQELKKAYLHGKTIIVIPGKILVIGLQPKEIRAEIRTEKTPAQQELMPLHVAKDLFIKEGARIFVIEILYMDIGFEQPQPILQVGKELVNKKPRDDDDQELQG